MSEVLFDTPTDEGFGAHACEAGVEDPFAEHGGGWHAIPLDDVDHPDGAAHDRYAANAHDEGHDPRGRAGEPFAILDALRAPQTTTISHHDGSTETFVDLDRDGDPELVRYDSDGDGRPEGSEIDSDGDGVLDRALWDADHDGVPEQITADTDNNGRVDVFVQDTDGNGSLDSASLDADLDGSTDTWLNDTDSDGRMDRVRADVDDDGTVDVSARDHDGDGRYDSTYLGTAYLDEDRDPHLAC